MNIYSLALLPALLGLFVVSDGFLSVFAAYTSRPPAGYRPLRANENFINVINIFIVERFACLPAATPSRTPRAGAAQLYLAQ